MFRFTQTIIRELSACAYLKLQCWLPLHIVIWSYRYCGCIFCSVCNEGTVFNILSKIKVKKVNTEKTINQLDLPCYACGSRTLQIETVISARVEDHLNCERNRIVSWCHHYTISSHVTRWWLLRWQPSCARDSAVHAVLRRYHTHTIKMTLVGIDRVWGGGVGREGGIYLAIYLWESNYLLTPWSRVPLEKQTSSQPVKKFPVDYGTRWFIAAFTIACHLSLTSARSIQSIQPHPTSSGILISRHDHVLSFISIYF